MHDSTVYIQTLTHIQLHLSSMLMICRPSLHAAPALPAKTRVPLPKELVFLMPEPSAPTPTQTHITVPAAPEISAEPCRPTLRPTSCTNTK
ncbi:hypothetical protein CesoFtcFv8_015735 [Champsocephalus esox]|uniref:Uncharacterized protein n=1 Tax=Champsocephalus esox TaxID=159716 RepID=A0AAN8BNI8_9TELE|nr:hypothetical protein CesoFtcFv8_015735 [Champsocephalus esox]